MVCFQLQFFIPTEMHHLEKTRWQAIPSKYMKNSSHYIKDKTESSVLRIASSLGVKMPLLEMSKSVLYFR